VSRTADERLRPKALTEGEVGVAHFPATPTGDAIIEETLTLPSPCLAPVVFVTNPTGRWFAVTGF
jgi:hypothetical protein